MISCIDTVRVINYSPYIFHGRFHALIQYGFLTSHHAYFMDDFMHWYSTVYQLLTIHVLLYGRFDVLKQYELSNTYPQLADLFLHNYETDRTYEGGVRLVNRSGTCESMKGPIALAIDALFWLFHFCLVFSTILGFFRKFNYVKFA